VTYKDAEQRIRESDAANSALIQLLLAYAKGEETRDVEWGDIDLAVEYAKDALPGEYERIIDELQFDDVQDTIRARFKEEIEPLVIERYGPDDEIALNEAFNDWTDGLCKDGEISDYAYHHITRTDD
jgi:hypothetical protein